MDQIARYLFAFFVRLGGFGLLTLGMLDSSFLFMPLGNDLLLVAMTARNHSQMLYYAAMSAAGSVLGCLLVDVIFRKGGEQGLEKHLSPKRIEYIKRKVNARAGWAIAFACLMPPPFPFTPFIMGAAALQYSRRKMLAIVGSFRMVRFSTEGMLAILFGRRILKLAELSAVRYGIAALVILFVIGSGYSIYRWVRRSRRV